MAVSFWAFVIFKHLIISLSPQLISGDLLILPTGAWKLKIETIICFAQMEIVAHWTSHQNGFAHLAIGLSDVGDELSLRFLR